MGAGHWPALVSSGMHLLAALGQTRAATERCIDKTNLRVELHQQSSYYWYWACKSSSDPFERTGWCKTHLWNNIFTAEHGPEVGWAWWQVWTGEWRAWDTLLKYFVASYRSGPANISSTTMRLLPTSNLSCSPTHKPSICAMSYIKYTSISMLNLVCGAWYIQHLELGLTSLTVVKNPLSPVEHRGGEGVANELFELALDQFVKGVL